MCLGLLRSKIMVVVKKNCLDKGMVPFSIKQKTAIWIIKISRNDHMGFGRTNIQRKKETKFIKAKQLQ